MNYFILMIYMDTTFWGPPAWILLHTIAYNYVPTELNKETYRLFFENLQNILPCIYCRASYIEYISYEPIKLHLDSSKDLSLWLYKIHNLVNDKLRSQNLLKWENPSFEDIYKRYSDANEAIERCQTRCQSIMGWNFLYCIAFVFPENGRTEAQTSHYNGYHTFFNTLAQVLPEKGGYQDMYNQYLKKYPILEYLESREKLKKWIYNLESVLNNKLKIKCEEFAKIEDEIENYRAGCDSIKSDLKPTCRRIFK
jgi:hypothetical protein